MFHIISNPISGRKKKKNTNEEILNYLKENGIEYQLYESQYYKHPQEIAKTITSENESGDIIVIGGDGTFNEVINGIVDLSKWNVGLIPAGSGNDFAACLNLPKNPIECLKLILKKEVKPVDYIKANGMVCANVLGTGIDVDVLINFEKHKRLKGSFRYFYSLIETILHIKWHEFDVSIDDGPFEHKKGFVVTLCNGNTFGGGITICPNADPADGKMEFVFVEEMKKRKIPGALIKLMKKRIFDIKGAQHIYCQKAVFKDNSNIMLQIDGNITNDYSEYVCEIIKNGLNMYR